MKIYVLMIDVLLNCFKNVLFFMVLRSVSELNIFIKNALIHIVLGRLSSTVEGRVGKEGRTFDTPQTSLLCARDGQ